MLSEGQRERPLAAAPFERRPIRSCGTARASLLFLLQGFRQLRDRRALEDPTQRKLGAKGRTDAGDHPGGQQGMPADLKEVVVNPDAIDAQHFGKHVRELLLAVTAWRGVALIDKARLRRRQPPAVHLSVGGQGHRLELDE